MELFGNQNCFPTDFNAAEHQCNIIFQERFSFDKNKSKKRNQKEAWRRHVDRIESLSKPKKKISKNISLRDSKGIHISKLLPRIKSLSQPKHFTPKYAKPPEEHFELPGKITDWESHKNWLKLRAQPRRYNINRH